MRDEVKTSKEKKCVTMLRGTANYRNLSNKLRSHKKD